eukprot:Skav201412  [mRNA]  locus=scaffold83:107873:110391:+ [translate_table: standard]
MAGHCGSFRVCLPAPWRYAGGTLGGTSSLADELRDWELRHFEHLQDGGQKAGLNGLGVHPNQKQKPRKDLFYQGDSPVLLGREHLSLAPTRPTQVPLKSWCRSLVTISWLCSESPACWLLRGVRHLSLREVISKPELQSALIIFVARSLEVELLNSLGLVGLSGLGSELPELSLETRLDMLTSVLELLSHLDVLDLVGEELLAHAGGAGQASSDDGNLHSLASGELSARVLLPWFIECMLQALERSRVALGMGSAS